MTITRPKDAAALLILDQQAHKVLLGRKDGQYTVPLAFLDSSDGKAPGPFRKISTTRLGAPEHRASAFMDAALRASVEHLGLMITTQIDPPPPPARGLWGRIARHGLIPDRMQLTYLGRALSPADAPERWHIRVFTAPYGAVANSLRRTAPTDRPVWMGPDEAQDVLSHSPVAPFPGLAFKYLGAHPKPLLASYRSGRLRLSRL